MKKFIKVLVCLCLCVISIGFTACGGKGKIETPESSALVSSNGGIVVNKGDFIYFTNGYVAKDDVTKSMLKKGFKNAGLYMAKENENGVFSYKENGSVDSAKRLSSRLSGFEASDLHIFGDYLYFTTVNKEETKNGEIQTGKLEIYRIKLNGNNLTRVYRSSVEFLDSEGAQVVTFDYFNEDDNVYILINENGKLKHIKCTNSSVGGVKSVDSDVLSLVVPENNDYNNIFYTKTDEDRKYVVNRLNAKTGEVATTKTCDKDDVIDSLFASKFGYLYFYATFDMKNTKFLYRISYSDFEEQGIKYTNCQNNQLTYMDYTAVYLLENEVDGILAISSSKVEIINTNNPLTVLELQENLPASANVMLIKNGYVYFYTDNTIKRWNYTTDEAETVYEEENTVLNYAFDIDESYIYYYATKGENDYLFRVKFADTTPEKTSHLVGTYLEADEIKPEEETEE